MANANANAPEVTAVALKLPPFWQDRPAAWFHTTEAQFHIRNIADEVTKFYYVVSSLDGTVAAQMEDVLAVAPAAGSYTRLKEALTKRYGLTDEQKTSLLFSINGLGDRKPSELLRYLRTLHRSAPADKFFMAFFLHQLPSAVRAILAAQTFPDIDAMAVAADNILAEQAAPSTYVVQRSKSQPSKVTSGTKEMTAQSGLCYYHSRFGHRAHKCRPPCTWSGNGVASN